MRTNTWRFIGVFILVLGGFANRAHAQGGGYQPDTSLTYETFLDQCINFKEMDRQEVWVVFFWASWSTPSIYELDNLKATYSLYQQKPVRFVGVSVDKIRSRWVDALMREQMPWEQLMIPKEEDYAFIRRAFRHNSLPAIFLVNDRGEIRRINDAAELKSELYLATRYLPDQPYRKPGVQIIDNNAENANTSPPENDIVEVPPPLPDTEAKSQADPSPLPSQPTGWVTHTVKSGDTLYSLYRRYSVPVSEIKRINGLRSNLIRTGQVLRIKQVN